MPEKVRVDASNVSQDGRAATVGQSRRVGQAAAVDVSEGACRNLERPWRILGHTLIGDGHGHHGRVVDRRDCQRERVGGAERAVAGRDLEVDRAAEILRRRAGEGAGRSIEGEPGRQAPRRWPASPCRSGCCPHRQTRPPAPGTTRPCPQETVWSAIGVLTTGASLTGSMVSVNVSDDAQRSRRWPSPSARRSR